MPNKQNTIIEIESSDYVLEIVGALVDLLEEVDPFLRTHSERVANNCANFCEEYKLVDEEEIDIIFYAALLHDIGLVGVPRDVLQKDPLNDEEKILVKRHPVSGANILSNLSCMNKVIPIIRHHHETMDGSGYPAGIKDTEIPFGARILCLFNYFDQLISGRSAEKRIPIPDAIDQIRNKAKQLFDEEILPDFISFIESQSGKSENYLLKKEKTFIRETFSQILHHFKTGKLTPPVVPHVVKEIQSVFKSESATADELANVLEKDPVISLRLISIANSPIYRGFSEIRNVRNAIPRLGLKETMSLVIAIAHKSLYQTDKVQFKILMDKLWLHSLATAYGAKLLAHELMLDDPEYLFFLGVTHDIGKIVMLKAFSDILAGKSFQMDAIRSNLQEGHIEITRMLLKRWGFGEDFIMIVTHHEAEACNSSTEKEILIINLANTLTGKIGFGLIEVDVEFSELESVKLLKMEPEKIEGIGKEIKNIIQNVAHLF